MKEGGLTRQERNLATLLHFFALSSFLAAILFILLPDTTLLYITHIGIGIFGWQSRIPAFGHERFWLILAITLLFTLSYACWIASRDRLRAVTFTRVIIVAKFVSAVGFTICFVGIEPLFIYLVGAIVDGGIFIVTWYSYRLAVTSRPQAPV